MPLIQSSQDHLQFADPSPSPAELSSARDLITESLPSDTSAPHPSLPTLRTPQYSDLVSASHDLLASGKPQSPSIDLSRYEEPSAPTSNDLSEWRTVLQRAYTSSEYLSSRLTNLSLLETYGKNAWLVSNSALEDILKDLEKEVAALKLEAQELEGQRRLRQGAAKGELDSLEASWREGVGRCVEVQAAAEGLRREILERRRGAAMAG